MSANLRERNWHTSGKNRTYLRGGFCIEVSEKLVEIKKTPGYHRDKMCGPTLLKMPFRRIKSFFNVFCSSIVFLIFPQFFFNVEPIKLKNDVKRQFKEIILLQTHFS